MNSHLTHAAEFAAEAAPGAQVLGTITASGVALIIGTLLLLGLRGSDTIRINTKQSVGVTSIIFGIVALAAGGAWADIANGIHSIPSGALEGDASGRFGDPGPAAVSIVLALLTFGPKWKRMIIPAFLGIATAVAATRSGGYGTILTDLIRSTILRLAGAE
ncbi:hypothetical protein [Streptomyces sp. NBRC 109706]|uniref:hypothetical protein n=1 Tax=Streptomyces sp. NBRC 109706 TaxID=1550035 RepID=UPI000784EEE7|nr:hypothetical protein [Streptomyces sp. NBRC 109706]